MREDASVPKALYQANIDLALRIAALLQENGAQWFDLFAAEANARLEAGVTGSKDSAFPLPPELALKWGQVNPIRWQALLAQAANNQARFAEGLQAALTQWQAACSDAFEVASGKLLPDAPDLLASVPGWQELGESMREFVARWVPGFEASVSVTRGGAPAATPVPDQPAAKAPAAGKAATKTAATKTVATKKTAARKAAARKPAAEQPAAKKPATPAAKSTSKPATARKAPGKSGASTPAATTAQGKRSKAAAKPRPVPPAVTRSRRSDKPEP